MLETDEPYRTHGGWKQSAQQSPSATPMRVSADHLVLMRCRSLVLGCNDANDTGTIQYNTRTSHVRSSGETKVAHG